VCHGNVIVRLQRVCLSASDGQVVKSYSGLKGSGSQQMNVPLHLAIDRNGFVFVVDVTNCQVLLLSPSLTLCIREVVTCTQVKRAPKRVLLDVERHCLYVADNEYKDGTYTAGRVVVVSML